MPIQKTDPATIVTQALEIIRQRGYHRTSMADVAKACGLLKGSLYHHFPSKEALALAAMARVERHFHEQVFSWAQHQQLSPEQRLEGMMAETQRYFTGREGGCLMGNLALEAVDTVPEFGPVVRRYFEQWIDALAQIYAAKYQSEVARERAALAVAELQGGLMMMRVFKDPAIFVRHCERIVQAFRNA